MQVLLSSALSLLLLAPLAAQQNPILKSVEPDYGDDAQQPMLTLPFVVEFEVTPDGVPFSLASQDGGLDHRVVQALAQYRFAKTPRGIKMIVAVPVKQTISTYDVGEHAYQPPPASAFKAAAKIDPTKLAKYEKDLPRNNSEPKRAELLTFAASQSGDEINAMRARQLDWLIQNEPSSEILHTSAALISKVEDPAGYSAIRQLWLARVKQNPVDYDLLRGASTFLRLSDSEDVTAMLAPYAGKMLHAMEWLGEMYGLQAIGAASVDPTSGIILSAATTLPSTAVAASARTQLVQGSDLPILLSGFATMNAAARTLNASGRLPTGYEGLCTGVLSRIKALKPNFDGACQNRAPGLMLLSHDVMQGKLTKQVRPNYPEAARRNRLQGAVLLGAIIGKDGKITKLTLLGVLLHRAARLR